MVEINNLDKGIYIHIPFCKQKCFYCDFVSFCDKDEYIERYWQAIKKEIEFKNKLVDSKISTIYYGGGTPSYIDANIIVDILKTIKENYTLTDDCEITIEVNPGTITKEKLELYFNAGINRISIGLQTANDELLKKIGRIHSYDEFIETYQLARQVGFKNINVDLMFGLPGQTVQDLKLSLENIIKLSPEHISVYSLILEEGTKLYDLVKEKKVDLPYEDTERNMYWYIKNTLELNGYNHYEISNFSKIGYESKHNINCWKQMEYIGFGTAAHSYLDSKRFSNIESVKIYIENIENYKMEKNSIIHEEQNEEEIKKEFMLLGLRKIQGVNIQDFKNKFGDSPIFMYMNELSKLVDDGLIIIEEDNIRLTSKGLDFANIVWEEFV